MTKRVVVVGLGHVSPVGNSVEIGFNNLSLGKSGIDTVPAFLERVHDHPTTEATIGGLVKDFNPEDFVEPKKDVKRMGRFIHLAMAATQEAWAQSGLPPRLDDCLGNRAGCVLGVGMLGLDFLLENHSTLLEKGGRRVSAFFIPGTISNLAPGHVGIKRNLRLDNWTIASACASGTHAIGEAFNMIRYGRADIMVAGGTESSMHPLAIAGFENMHALCKSHNADPKGASKPFDKKRDGFVMGEGAGILVLEEYEHAKKRGADIISEVVGYGSTCDANHITAPAPKGEGAQRAMAMAISSAQILPRDIGYINAHGTSTPLNDKQETEAIKEVFASHAYKLMVSSTKSMTGHLLGAAGGVEAVFTVMALKTGIIPPTINLHDPDPECDLDYVPNKAKEAKINYALSNSFGFGGTNGVIVLKRFAG